MQRVVVSQVQYRNSNALDQFEWHVSLLMMAFSWACEHNHTLPKKADKMLQDSRQRQVLLACSILDLVLHGNDLCNGGEQADAAAESEQNHAKALQVLPGSS